MAHDHHFLYDCAQIAEAAKAKVPGAVTELAPLKLFYPAEAYHQQYLEKVC
jgi:peptide methionine sulfoxide reductase MsrA